MKHIKKYLIALVILSLNANILPLRGRVAAFAVGTSVGRNNSNYDESDRIVSKQIKRHELEITKNNKKLASERLSPQQRNDLLASNREHETAIKDLIKKQA